MHDWGRDEQQGWLSEAKWDIIASSSPPINWRCPVPVVEYAGRSQTGPDEWTVLFDLVVSETEKKRYWCRFRTSDDPDIDIADPRFWGHLAYLSGRLIENKQIHDASTGELFSEAPAAAFRVKVASPHPKDPDVGDVCWTY